LGDNHNAEVKEPIDYDVGVVQELETTEEKFIEAD